MLSIPLRSIKTRRSLGQLDYVREQVTKMQARLAGRVALIPQIDLDDFVCRAVIDFIVVEVHLGRSSQHQWLRQTAAPILGRNCYARPIDGASNGVADRFSIRIQEPHLGKVRELMAGLETEFGLRDRPRVAEIEFSVDFKPKSPDASKRAKLFMTLTQHLFPTRDVLSVLNDRPRFTYARGRKGTIQVIERDRYYPRTDAHHRTSTESGNSPFVDACYYVGARQADSAWRIMDKVVDRQDPLTGSRLDLDEKSKRVRVEVTLQRRAVLANGVDLLSDLPNLRYATLQGAFFRFVIPTFANLAQRPANKFSAARGRLERNREEKFLLTGVVGLQSMDEALERQRDAARPAARMILRQRGLMLKPKPRVGRGPSGAFVAFDELNTRVATALRKLGDRVGAEWSQIRSAG